MSWHESRRDDGTPYYYRDGHEQAGPPEGATWDRVFAERELDQARRWQAEAISREEEKDKRKPIQPPSEVARRFAQSASGHVPGVLPSGWREVATHHQQARDLVADAKRKEAEFAAGMKKRSRAVVRRPAAAEDGSDDGEVEAPPARADTGTAPADFTAEYMLRMHAERFEEGWGRAEIRDYEKGLR